MIHTHTKIYIYIYIYVFQFNSDYNWASSLLPLPNSHESGPEL